MKNLLAEAVTDTQQQWKLPHQQGHHQPQQEEPSLLVIQKEIQSVQVQLFHQNFHIGCMEKQLQSMQQQEPPGASAKNPIPVESSDD